MNTPIIITFMVIALVWIFVVDCINLDDPDDQDDKNNDRDDELP